MALSDEPPGDGYLSTPTPPLSINRLLALYPRERLLVHPLCWTDRQPALLGCRIHTHEEADSAGPDENAGAASKSDRLAAFLAERLNFQLHHEELASTIAQLLQPLGGRISIDLKYVRPISIAYAPLPTNLHVLTPLGWPSRRVSLYFNRRSFASIGFRHLSVSIGRPIPEIIVLACLDYGGAMLERESYFKPPSNPRHTDWEGLRRSYTLTKLHTPANPQTDPLVVALTIALAQNDRRHAAQPLPPDSSFTVGPSFTFPVVPSRSTTLSLGSQNHQPTSRFVS
jgi:hypothetical protein